MEQSAEATFYEKKIAGCNKMSFPMFNQQEGSLDAKSVFDNIDDLNIFAQNIYRIDFVPSAGMVCSVANTGMVYILSQLKPEQSATYTHSDNTSSTISYEALHTKPSAYTDVRDEQWAKRKHFYPVEIKGSDKIEKGYISASHDDDNNGYKLTIGELNVAKDTEFNRGNGNIHAEGNITSDKTVQGKDVKATDTVEGKNVKADATEGTVSGHTISGDIVNGTTINGGTINSTGNVKADGNVEGTNVTASNQVNAKTLVATESIESKGSITGVNGTITNLKSDSVTTPSIKSASDADTNKIGSYMFNTIGGTANGWLDNLTIRGSIHANSIEIDEAKYSSGIQWWTPGGGFVVTDVVATTYNNESAYKLFFKNEEDDGTKIQNKFLFGDGAFCQRYEYNDSGLTIKTYWMRVLRAISNEDYIIVSNTRKKEGLTGIPAIGDKVVQLGSDTPSRRAARCIDTISEGAPFDYQYNNVTLFDLGEASMIVSPANNKFSGEFISKATGKNIETIISEVVTNVDNLGVDLDKVAAQADKSYAIWFGTEAPTLANEPAKDWNTTALKEVHEEDIYYNSTSGLAYRFQKDGSTWSWNNITDQYTVKALQDAYNAQHTANEAKDELEDIADDNLITIYEHSQLSDIFDSAKSAYNIAIADANVHTDDETIQSNKTALTTAYNALNTIVSSILAMTSDYTIVSAYTTAWSTFYAKLQELNESITSAVNVRVGAAESTIENLGEAIALAVKTKDDAFSATVDLDTTGIKIGVKKKSETSTTWYSGFVTSSNFNSMFTTAVTFNGIAKTAEIKTEVEDQISKASISADKIIFSASKVLTVASSSGTLVTIDNTNGLYAIKGTIGGWSLGANELRSANKACNNTEEYESFDYISFNSADGIIGNFHRTNAKGSDTADTERSFWHWKANSDGSFDIGSQIDEDGKKIGYAVTIDKDGNAVFNGVVHASSGSFSGTVTSNEGTIGGWTIDSNGIQSPEIGCTDFDVYHDGKDRLVLDKAGIIGSKHTHADKADRWHWKATKNTFNIGLKVDGEGNESYSFSVAENGNASFSGKIQSTSGNIAGWNISSELTSPEVACTLDTNATSHVQGYDFIALNGTNGTVGCNHIARDTDGVKIADKSLWHWLANTDGSFSLGGYRDSEGKQAYSIKTDKDGNATFRGTVYATNGTFAGELSAATGTFAGDISAASGTFSGTVKAQQILVKKQGATTDTATDYIDVLDSGMQVDKNGLLNINGVIKVNAIFYNANTTIVNNGTINPKDGTFITKPTSDRTIILPKSSDYPYLKLTIFGDYRFSRARTANNLFKTQSGDRIIAPFDGSIHHGDTLDVNQGVVELLSDGTQWCLVTPYNESNFVIYDAS